MRKKDRRGRSRPELIARWCKWLKCGIWERADGNSLSLKSRRDDLSIATTAPTAFLFVFQRRGGGSPICRNTLPRAAEKQKETMGMAADSIDRSSLRDFQKVKKRRLFDRGEFVGNDKAFKPGTGGRMTSKSRRDGRKASEMRGSPFMAGYRRFQVFGSGGGVPSRRKQRRGRRWIAARWSASRVA